MTKSESGRVHRRACTFDRPPPCVERKHPWRSVIASPRLARAGCLDDGGLAEPVLPEGRVPTPLLREAARQEARAEKGCREDALDIEFEQDLVD
jgi:hypothetical protein